MGAQVFLRELRNEGWGKEIPKCGMIWSLEGAEDNSKKYSFVIFPKNAPPFLCKINKIKKNKKNYKKSVDNAPPLCYY